MVEIMGGQSKGGYALISMRVNVCLARGVSLIIGVHSAINLDMGLTIAGKPRVKAKHNQVGADKARIDGKSTKNMWNRTEETVVTKTKIDKPRSMRVANFFSLFSFQLMQFCI